MGFAGRYDQTLAPAIEPVSFADMEDHARISDADLVEQGYVESLVAKARRYVERTLSRQLITATWQLSLEAFPEEIELWKLPVQSVASIQYVDADGVAQTLDEDQYQVDVAGQDVPARIKPAYGCSWPTTRGDTYGAVTVTFLAGYGAESEDVPETIRHGIELLTAHLYRLREPVNVGYIVNAVPLTLEAMLGIEDWGGYS